MNQYSWSFLDDLDNSEKKLLLSAAKLSGLHNLSDVNGHYDVIAWLKKLCAGRDYHSFLNILSSTNKSVEELERMILLSQLNPTEKSSYEQSYHIVRLAFVVLDIKGFTWQEEIRQEIYLSPSNPQSGYFVYGKDIQYSLPQGKFKRIELSERMIHRRPQIWNFRAVSKLPFLKNYFTLQDSIIPILCALIIIRNERAFSFSSARDALNFVCAHIDGNKDEDCRQMAVSLSSERTRYLHISRHKWEKLKFYEKDIEQLLLQRSNDDGTFYGVDWNYSIHKELIVNNILAKRRHAFMHAISDDIKGVIEKLKRDCGTNLLLNKYKGQEILDMLEIYNKWRKSIIDVPLDDMLSDEIIKTNIDLIVRRGNELLDTFSPFFHSLVDKYAFLFPDHQDGNNVAYNRLIGFINDEEKLRKEIMSFSNTKSYRPFEEISINYVLALIQQSLQEITTYVSIMSNYNYSNDVIIMNSSDFDEYVLKNFISNLKEKAYYRREHTKRKILISVSQQNQKIAIGLSNNGEPFNGDVNRVFEERYTYGENKGSGQGLFDAKQYMNYIHGDIQMKVFPYMEYPVRFALLFPIITKKIL